MPEVISIQYIICGVLFFALLVFLRVTRGKRAEKHVAMILNRLPKEGYEVINDIMLRQGGRTSQIDHVVVSSFGIFVIETKNYQGIVSGSEHKGQWTQNIYGHKYDLYNPIYQNESHVRALRRCLDDNGSLKVIPIVVFSNKTRLYVHTEDSIVIKMWHLKRTIESYRVVYYLHDEVENMANELRLANITDRESRRAHKFHARNTKAISMAKVSSGICPRCGGSLVERKGKYGIFMGCSNFPKCKYTSDIR